MESDRAGSDVGRGGPPGHVAWAGLGSERWARRAGSGIGADAAALGMAEDRAVLELVEGSLDAGVGWLSIQHPAAARPLAGRVGELARRGVHVLQLRTGTVGGRGLEPLGESTGTTGLSDAKDATHDLAPALRVVLVPGASGRQELVDVVRTLGERGLRPDEVDEAAISETLDVPDVDLLVVTGGDRRVPDLLLWQIAYSEIVFLGTLWPDVGRGDLDAALEAYRRRDRRYGGLVASR